MSLLVLSEDNACREEETPSPNPADPGSKRLGVSR